ncbi:exonuclease domain-containing protein [Rheinheimera sp.]|uniref:3'-5' exonuclease n=1 Tax=Rheinheimera sp. TaxID=1869214 RepID=UPI003AF6F662
MWSWFRKAEPVHQQIRQYEAGLPDKRARARDCSYLVLDFETTGLDPGKHHIVSAGWVCIEQQRILLSSAQYHLVRAPVSVGQSAVIHGLHNPQLQSGTELHELLELLLQQAQGKVLVSHHSGLELNFLRQACLYCYGRPARFRMLDTLKLELFRLQLQGRLVAQDKLTLAACLERHQLPAISEHQALSDAFGCAQLFLTQLQQRDSGTSLADLLSQSR